MKTEKQLRASRRNFMLMRIAGDINVYKLFRDRYVKTYILKGMLNVVISTLQKLHVRILQQKVECPDTYITDNFYIEPQTDVKYECKESNQ